MLGNRCFLDHGSSITKISSQPSAVSNQPETDDEAPPSPRADHSSPITYSRHSPLTTRSASRFFADFHQIQPGLTLHLVEQLTKIRGFLARNDYPSM
jgi:hypothetical protein